MMLNAIFVAENVPAMIVVCAMMFFFGHMIKALWPKRKENQIIK
ncbi:MAG: hypothetical protein WC010_02060 [Candidatus Absconditabacterales bacterium]